MSERIKTLFSNHELVTVAVFLLGGDSKAADVEDIAKKVNDLAPGRFTWRKYPDQINIKNVDAFLWDAKKPKNGSFVLNVGRDEWVLTEQGLAFARKRVKDLQGIDVSRKPMTSKERNWLRRERERMLASDAFAKFSAGDQSSISVQEAEAYPNFALAFRAPIGEKDLLRLSVPSLPFARRPKTAQSKETL